jgi:hypothetical protein
LISRDAYPHQADARRKRLITSPLVAMYKKNDFKETPKYFSLLMTGIVSASKGAISSEMFINSSMTYKCNAIIMGKI